jgi:hypothetical protein
MSDFSLQAKAIMASGPILAVIAWYWPGLPWWACLLIAIAPAVCLIGFLLWAFSHWH